MTEPNNPLIGRCPICAEELAPEGDLLRCPAGDYSAKAIKFLKRWEQYFEQIRAKPVGYIAVKESDSLLYDLQEMKEKRKEQS